MQELSHLLIFRLPTYPRTIGYRLYRIGRWVVKYSILGHKYDREAQIHLTKETLRIRDDIWDMQPEEEREKLLKAKVWTPKGMKDFFIFGKKMN